jgi:3-hydroxybutyryl-CoA dehydrogenase
MARRRWWTGSIAAGREQETLAEEVEGDSYFSLVKQSMNVGVIGCGLMGAGIAQVCAEAGHRTWVCEVDESLLAKGMGRIRGFLENGVAKGKVSGEARERVLGNLRGTTRLGELADCDLVIEAIVEDLAEKRRVYAALDGVVGEGTVFASNTSSLCITELAAATRRPDRFAGLHFFNPVPLMKLVEVIRALTTSDETHQTVLTFARSLGKEAITAPDRPGFIVNRLLVPYLLDAIRAYERGLGTLEDIDKGMQLGCGHPMGPFTLLDLVGLDTTYAIARIMFEELGEPAHAPPALLKRMVLAGRLGRKSGRGFYSY